MLNVSDIANCYESACIRGNLLFYAHLRKTPEHLHGVDDEDIAALNERLHRVWRQDGARADRTAGEWDRSG